MSGSKNQDRIQHTCSGADKASCRAWKSYFQFSRKGNTLLHFLLNSEHVADWLRVRFVSLGTHFIVFCLGIQGTNSKSIWLWMASREAAVLATLKRIFFTCLLTHNFHGSLVRHSSTESSVQGPTRLQSTCQSGLLSHLRLIILFQAHRWQNSVPCSYRTEILVLSMHWL